MKKNSNFAILLKNILILLTLATFLFGLLTIFAVGHWEIKNSQDNGDLIVARLKKTEIDSSFDWEVWRYNSTIDTSQVYIHVHNMRADAKQKDFYSPNTKKQIKNLTLINSVKKIFGYDFYLKGDKLFLLTTGHAKGIRYYVWQDLFDEKQLIKSVIKTVLVVWLIVLLLGTIYATVLADHLTAPLLDLRDAAKKKRSHDEEKLPVPKRPLEVRDLAISFNALLDELYQQYDQEKSFVNNAAHELRTPIATILSHAQLIRRRGEAHPEIVPQSVSYIEEESVHMKKLVDELLILARSDQAQHLTKERVDLNILCQKAQAEAGHEVKQRIVFVNEDQENLKVFADAASLQEILVNFLTNAGKYSASDQAITLKLAKDGKLARISVADQGIGMSAEEKAHAFDRFYRGAEVRGKIEGTGLGLAISQKLAELNQGQITISDQQPQGTIFTLILPLMQDE